MEEEVIIAYGIWRLARLKSLENIYLRAIKPILVRVSINNTPVLYLKAFFSFLKA